MKTTTVFKSGNSLAVRLPKGYDLPLGRVTISHCGKGILLEEANDWPEGFFDDFDGEAAKHMKRLEQGEDPPVKVW